MDRLEYAMQATQVAVFSIDIYICIDMVYFSEMLLSKSNKHPVTKQNPEFDRTVNVLTVSD